MTPKKILALTLLATSLTLHASIARVTQHTTLEKHNSITQTIASFLVQRGIEDSKAVEIASSFVGTNEELFYIMTQNYMHQMDINSKEFYSELAKLSLQKRKASFNDYSFLVKLTQTLKGHALNSKTFTNLHNIATNNSFLQKVFA
jgi:hypothetical protein